MKRLKIKVQKTQWGSALQIKEQTHRCHNFGIRSDAFVASNGFSLFSFANISANICEAGPSLCLRGFYRSKDNTKLIFLSTEEYRSFCDYGEGVVSVIVEDAKLFDWYILKLLEAVKEYNEVFKD